MRRMGASRIAKSKMMAVVISVDAAYPLLQLRVLGFGFFQDWDVRVGVFPEREEIFVGGERPDAGSVGICTSTP